MPNPKVKPALKHPAKAAAAPMDSDDKKEKHLTWDEHAIEEHDVLRGTRMKVRCFLEVNMPRDPLCVVFGSEMSVQQLNDVMMYDDV